MTLRNRITLSDSWEYYPVTLNEDLASIRVDLLAKETLPTAVHTHYIRIGFDTSDNGMPTPDEVNRLNELEDLIEAKLLLADDIYHVGTILSQGIMDLFYVSEALIDWKSTVKIILPDLNHVADTFENDAYSLYDTSLYPSVYDFNTIQNRNLCMQLEQNAMSPEIERPIDFYFTFPLKEQAESFVQTLNPKFEIVNASLSDDQKFILQINLVLPPTFPNMNVLTTQLLKGALEFDGVFDGWGI